jgi:hypothetical protein
MNPISPATRSKDIVPKASCFVAIFSTLPVLWFFLFANPTDEYGFPLACLSIALAAISIAIGLLGLLVARPFAYSIAGIMLGSIVFVFWSLLFLMAILTVMIALP